jgi:hypothetical protein
MYFNFRAAPRIYNIFNIFKNHPLWNLPLAETQHPQPLPNHAIDQADRA